MKIPFYKYQGTGNDFIIIDFFNSQLHNDDGFKLKIPFLCKRKWGIGSDGLILIEKSLKADFKMTFFNPDGSKSFCGNGARCAIKFAFDHQFNTSSSFSFEAFDGIHKGRVVENDLVELEMSDVLQIKEVLNGSFIDTGAPHYVENTIHLESIALFNKAIPIRNDEAFSPVGTNVNFIQELKDKTISIRTFEKGVEDETLSCGTGVTASVIHYLKEFSSGKYEVNVLTRGGELKVILDKNEDSFLNIKLIGASIKVFKGELENE